MKRRLNLLCALVLVVISWSVIETGYYMITGASIGFSAGYDYAKQKNEGKTAMSSSMGELNSMANMTTVSVVPDVFLGGEGRLMADSVYNVKSGRYVPATYGIMVVSVEKPENVLRTAVTSVAGFLAFSAVIWAMVLFIRLVVAINRSLIFNWRNVRRLRWLGLALLLSFGLSLLSAYLTQLAVEQVFALKGYVFSLSDHVPTTSLLLGLCALIVGEVFAIGLRLQEEQELTI